MDPTKFDRISRLFAERRLSRRAALAQSGAGLAAAGLAVTGLQHAAAQEASPVASDQKSIPYMFVQTFGAGSLAPKVGNDNMLTLTADHLAGQTVYFSDRPERVVGMVPTERFLGTGGVTGSATPEAGLGFTPVDPPNAALVFASAEGEDGPGDVVLVELIDPTYDPATGKATYDINILADESAVDLSLEKQPLAMADATRDFGAASLFIDDCPDGNLRCMTPGGDIAGDLTLGYCWHSDDWCCDACDVQDWATVCNQTYAVCNNQCQFERTGAFQCGSVL